MNYFKEEMYKKYSHAEVEDHTAQTTIFYTEESVIELMKLVRDKTLEWAAKNGKANYHYSYVEGHSAFLDKESILKGKENKFLKI